MTAADGVPPYKDITKDVKVIGYNQQEYFFCFSKTSVDKLNERCLYKLKDGSSFAGKLVSIESCVWGPRILVNVQKIGDGTAHLSAKLFGTPLNLGILLEDVVDITEAPTRPEF